MGAVPTLFVGMKKGTDLELQNEADISGKVKETVTQLLDNEGVELVELSFIGRGRGRVLRFLVDKPGGITLNECSRLNLRIGEILDSLNLIEDRYTLEVSSPGLDRPLRGERDFERTIGKLVRVNIAMPVDGKTSWVGEVKKVESGKLLLTRLDGGILELPLNQISSARLEIEF